MICFFLRASLLGVRGCFRWVCFFSFLALNSRFSLSFPRHPNKVGLDGWEEEKEKRERRKREKEGFKRGSDIDEIVYRMIRLNENPTTTIAKGRLGGWRMG